MTSIVIRILRNLAVAAIVGAALVPPAIAENGKPPDPPKPKAATDTGKPADAPKPKAVADKSGNAADLDASRYCANVAPSIAEARIAWQTKRLAELEGQVRQRIAELEKAEASARQWIARRDDLMKAARDDLVAIYAKMEPESAARQLAELDDRMAAAVLSKLKPSAAGAILGEMESDRASRLATLISGVNPEEKKS
jgi:flagellar motility protein MotE (MotC chaperone)